VQMLQSTGWVPGGGKTAPTAECDGTRGPGVRALSSAAWSTTVLIPLLASEREFGGLISFSSFRRAAESAEAAHAHAAASARRVVGAECQAMQ